MCTKRAENVSRLPLTPQQLEIPAHRQLSKSGQENLSTLSEHSVLSMDETLKIVLEWYQRLLTIHRLENIISDFETALIAAVQGSFPGVHVQGCYFHFFQAVLRTVADLELRTRMLLTEQNVDTPTNNHLEGWHFKMNRQAGKYHLGFYELLRLLIDEQGSTETLIQ
ncbi:hypothetical protein T02_14536 [Trichinella nativa]|uniref:MULE transposase domain-containing protein n=1 Tax=Trichinella nativa TaxID=6335 RepID=A0A0V1KSM4_9BILA|nr:hypothetical protein T02_3714 [Trichinella nativa]KRZ50824.1 hypothetical protein T02_14536 [Trichinella nativa]